MSAVPQRELGSRHPEQSLRTNPGAPQACNGGSNGKLPQSLWERLTVNAEANREMFGAAGVAVEDVRSLYCNRCRAQERAYYWTLLERSGQSVTFACPVCGVAAPPLHLDDMQSQGGRVGEPGVHVSNEIARALVVMVMLLLAGALFLLPGSGSAVAAGDAPEQASAVAPVTAR
jgi:hypothetical protein